MAESVALWLAFASFLAAMLLAFWPAARGLPVGDVLAVAVPLWLAVGTVAITLAITLRWLRLEQGPFLSLHEILISNVFSLGLIVLLVYLRVPSIRPAVILCLPVIVLLSVWSLMTPRAHVMLPATFDHPWLWLHVLFGKVFLGFSLLSAGCAIRVLRGASRDDGAGRVIDAWIWRFLAVAFVFDTLMLIAGAVWARDAWGRYWAWDPLETWAFITWLVLAAVLHVRVVPALSPRVAQLGVLLVFVLAFLTFFGVPFVSIAAHKGVM